MKNKEKKTIFQTRSNDKQKSARQNQFDLFQNTPLPTDQLLVNFPLYMRSSAVAKLLYINELYQHIIRVPGVIMEFGCWWGANMALCESLRAIYEPYNYTRKVIGFDTFNGYSGISSKDGDGKHIADGNYSVSEDYVGHLSQILDYHQEENVGSNVKKYEIKKGDAAKKLVEYLEDHPETIIALAYFDMQLYKPTKLCLEAIKPHLTKGSVIAMDELNNWEFPGETIAFNEALGIGNYRLIRSQFLPDRTYLIIE